MKDFSKNWKNSKRPGKQRKYVYNSPLHIRQKFMRSKLSKVLSQKYNKRTVGLRTGDTVKISRGQYKGKNGKVESVDLKKTRVYITGIETLKKEGSKSMIPIHPSNLIIEELNLDDKKRAAKIKQAVSENKA